MANTAPQDVIRQFIIDRGEAVSPATAAAGDWRIVSDFMPDDKGAAFDRYICCVGTGREDQGREFRGGHYFQYPTVQLLIRGKDDPTAQAKAYAIEEWFRQVGTRANLGWITVTVGSDVITVKSVTVKTPPTALMTTELNQRRLYVMNLRLDLKEL